MIGINSDSFPLCRAVAKPALSNVFLQVDSVLTFTPALIFVPSKLAPWDNMKEFLESESTRTHAIDTDVEIVVPVQYVYVYLSSRQRTVNDVGAVHPSQTLPVTVAREKVSGCDSVF